MKQQLSHYSIIKQYKKTVKEQQQQKCINCCLKIYINLSDYFFFNLQDLFTEILLQLQQIMIKNDIVISNPSFQL